MSFAWNFSSHSRPGRAGGILRRWGAVLGLLVSAILLPAQTPPPQVLVLDSYHAGYGWSDGERQGLLRVLLRRNPALVPSIEFLDSKREPAPAQRDTFLAFVREKYRGRRFDLIITLDDAALQFALAHRAALAPGAPIVFGGINHYRPEMLAGAARITGAAEVFDFAGNLELMLQLRPGLRTVHLICDSSESNSDTLEAFDRVAPRFAGRLQFARIENWTADELPQRLAALPPQDFALVINNARDAAGRIVSEDAAFIADLTGRSAVPIMLLAQPPLSLLPEVIDWEHAPWPGIGGRMLSSNLHGEAVGEIAGRVLAGEDPALIPVLTASHARLAFDYPQLMRHRLDPRRLPPDAELFNRPQSFLELYRGRILATLGVILLLVTAVVGLAISNVRRRRAELAFRRSNERFELLARATHDSIWELDPGTGILAGNETFNRQLGLASGATPGLDAFTRLVHPEDRAAFSALLAHPPAGAESASREIRLQSAGGQVRFALLRVCFRRNGPDQIGQIVGSMLDLTNLKRAERQLELLMTAIEQATDIIALLRADGAVVYANPALKRALPAAPAAAAPDCRAFWRDADGRPQPFAAVAGTVAATGRWQERITVPRPDGPDILLQVIVTPIAPGPDGAARFLLSGQDVTQQARLEEHMRLAQKMEAIGTLASGIAHDFNNILTAINGNTELALHLLPADHPAAALLGDAHAAAMRAARLVRQILTFSRPANSHREALRLTPVVAETLKFLRSTVPAAISLEHTVRNSPAIQADPTQVSQLVVNLCTNAAQAIGARSGRIEVSEEQVELDADFTATHPALQPGPHLLLTVRDDGCGMTPDIVRRIFEPFFTTKETGQGTGLGLAVVHGIVESHHAAISVYSAPGKGTVFRLYFPAVDAPAVNATAAGAPVASAPGQGQRLVVVDDDVAITRLLERRLRDLGYHVSIFNQPEAALAHLRAAGADLLVTDFSMPGLPTPEFIALVRAHAPALPVILISGYLGEAERKRLAPLGINRIIEKPFAADVFSQAVADLLAAQDGDGPHKH